MINAANKDHCCGCSACVQICPQKCIHLKEDEHGFLYPIIANDLCVDCGVCEKVCPYHNIIEAKKPLSVYAAINPNEKIRYDSSSGGIFTMLAESVINDGGIVFGARFDENWDVVHDYTDTIVGIGSFRGSKYVQSRIGETYNIARDYLKKGYKVLFSGTSCQILGLKLFLRREYENLITIDVVCHGVPSPLVWREYLKWINPHNEVISHVNMRDKSRGWLRYSYVIRNEENVFYDDYAANSPYLQAFSISLDLRPSCYNCPAKSGRALSDITLADNWSYAESSPEMFDNKGLSAVLIHSQKGCDMFNKIHSNSKKISYDAFISSNTSYCLSSTKTKFVNVFWNMFSETKMLAVDDVVNKMRPTLLYRFVNKFKSIFVGK